MKSERRAHPDYWLPRFRMSGFRGSRSPHPHTGVLRLQLLLVLGVISPSTFHGPSGDPNCSSGATPAGPEWVVRLLLGCHPWKLRLPLRGVTWRGWSLGVGEWVVL